MTIRLPSTLLRTAPLSAALIALTACSTNFDTLIPDRRPDYRQSKVMSNKLDVPPEAALRAYPARMRFDRAALEALATSLLRRA